MQTGSGTLPTLNQMRLGDGASAAFPLFGHLRHRVRLVELVELDRGVPGRAGQERERAHRGRHGRADDRELHGRHLAGQPEGVHFLRGRGNRPGRLVLGADDDFDHVRQDVIKARNKYNVSIATPDFMINCCDQVADVIFDLDGFPDILPAGGAVILYVSGGMGPFEFSTSANGTFFPDGRLKPLKP